jgi:hypothetical protein
LSAHTGLPGKKRLNEIQNLMARGDPWRHVECYVTSCVPVIPWMPIKSKSLLCCILSLPSFEPLVETNLWDRKKVGPRSKCVCCVTQLDGRGILRNFGCGRAVYSVSVNAAASAAGVTFAVIHHSSALEQDPRCPERSWILWTWRSATRQNISATCRVWNCQDNNYTLALFYARTFYVFFALTPLANLHHFLIYTLSYSV